MTDAESSCHTKIKKNRITERLYWLFFDRSFFWFNVVIVTAGFIWWLALASCVGERRFRLKLWDDASVTAGQSAVTDVYEFQLPAETDFIGQRSLPIHRFISPYTATSQFSLSFILPLTDKTTAAGFNVQSHCSELLMSSTKTVHSFSSLLPPVRTASCFLYHLTVHWPVLSLPPSFSITILQCFPFTAVPQLDW